jgi:2-isopropylmalate synthase
LIEGKGKIMTNKKGVCSMNNLGVEIYDTTLRDGAQTEGISFSLEDKMRIAQELDEFGVHYIEGGWPGSNPKDIEFFEKVKELKLQNAKIAAFGSTHNAKFSVENDPNILALLQADPEIFTIFGKSWDLHVKEVLKISLKRNLELIHNSVSFLKKHAEEVFYDAEHFFDGYKANPEYALKTIKAAQEAGADCIILCDTNGGMLSFEIPEIIKEVKKIINIQLGIHAHNDSETAVQNSLTAVNEGVTHVQGTINGYGERCGNANLCSVISNIKLKMNMNCIPPDNLVKLCEVSRFVSELANLQHNGHQPFVGKSAFAHKGGIHVNAMEKNSRTYEHVDPTTVGNCQRVLVSELSGRSNIIKKAKEYNININSENTSINKVANQLKEMENSGYQFEGAEGSFILLLLRVIGGEINFFSVENFEVKTEKKVGYKNAESQAIIKVKVQNAIEHTIAFGDGPVNALDNALRKALEKFYPELKEVKLLDFKVRILPGKSGTAARTRVLIESGDNHNKWGTVGVSDNIFEASLLALIDSMKYKLMMTKKAKQLKPEASTRQQLLKIKNPAATDAQHVSYA